MTWELSFISKKDFIEHVKETIKKYDDKLESYDIKKFNNNIIDPIKLIFDKTVYQTSWEEIIQNEIFRQRDKSNNNDIGYFHQNIFSYIKNCEVPSEGWDVIYKDPKGIALSDGSNVSSVYIEIKNKHNTMNSASASKTYIKMQSQILEDDDCACFLAEVIAKRSQDIKWETTVDKKKVCHKRIRRISIDQLYAMITGEQDAFYKLCLVLPDIINEVIKDSQDVRIPQDTVFKELQDSSKTKKVSFAMAIYFLGFNSYYGFLNRLDQS